MSARRIAIVVVGALTAPFAVALFVNALWTFCQWLGWSPEGAAVFGVSGTGATRGGTGPNAAHCDSASHVLPGIFA